MRGETNRKQAAGDILNGNVTARHEAAKNPDTPAETLAELAKDGNGLVREGVAMNPSAPAGTLSELAKDEGVLVRRAAAKNPSAPAEALALLAKDGEEFVRYEAAKNPSTPAETLAELAKKDGDGQVRRAAAENPNAPEPVRRKRMPTPGSLADAYRSGDAGKAKAAEKEMGDFVAAGTTPQIIGTYLSLKDRAKKEEDKPWADAFRFIAEACAAEVRKRTGDRKVLAERNHAGLARTSPDKGVLEYLAENGRHAEEIAGNPAADLEILEKARDNSLYGHGVPALDERIRSLKKGAKPEKAMETLSGTGDARLQARLDALNDAVRTIRGWIEGNVRGKSFTLELPERVKREIRRKTGRDFDSHNITSDSLRHILRGHGENGSKLTSASIPLREEDLELIPHIMTAPDRIAKGSTDATGRDSVRFYKNLSNGHVPVVEKEQKDSPNVMETITMWAELSSSNVSDARAQARPLNSTSQPANVAHGTNAAGADARTVTISGDDAAKIRKDAETAIEKEGKSKYFSTNGESDYGQYKLPEGVKEDAVRIRKHADGKWKVSVDLGDKGRTSVHDLSPADCAAYFRDKTATKGQIAAKYLGAEMKSLPAAPAKKERSKGMRR